MAAAISINVGTTDAFVPMTTSTRQRQNGGVLLYSEEFSSSSSSAASLSAGTSINVIPSFTIHDKIALRDPTPEERGKGGVEVASGSSIKALEVLARIPRDLIVSTVDAPVRAMEAASTGRNLTWATDLTAATLAALHPTEEEIATASSSKEGGDVADAVQAKKEWIQSWHAGGWGTDGADLGPPEANFGLKDVTGSLLATGSDNDHNVYAKFRMPCHPVILRASLGLELLTKDTADKARNALAARGFTYRSMRDALQPLVLESTERSKGSLREKRCWDVADTLSRVMSRATTLQLDCDDDNNATTAHAIVPMHERLAHSLKANSKLVSIGNEILLVATRDIAQGKPITRDYTSAPRMANDESLEGSALHLLLQFGLPPNAWPTN